MEKNLEYNAEERREYCEKWRASGLTQKVFCAKHDLNVKTLSRWLSLEQKKQPFKFSQVTAMSNNETVEVTLPSGISIKIVAKKDFFIGLIKGLL